jgi:hypothetical protein
MRTELSDVDVEIADFLRRLAAFDVRQSADAVALEADAGMTAPTSRFVPAAAVLLSPSAKPPPPH